MQTDSNSQRDEEQLQRLTRRLNELNNTSSQILIFLSFAIVGGVTYLALNLDPARKFALSAALHWWTAAIFPTVIGMIPLKEFNDYSVGWHTFLMWARFVLMWAGCICIFIGALYFFRSL